MRFEVDPNISLCVDRAGQTVSGAGKGVDKTVTGAGEGVGSTVRAPAMSHPRVGMLTLRLSGRLVALERT